MGKAKYSVTVNGKALECDICGGTDFIKHRSYHYTTWWYKWPHCLTCTKCGKMNSFDARIANIQFTSLL